MKQDQAVSMLEKRTKRRVSDAMALRVERADNASQAPLDPTPTHVVNLSTGGLRFLHEHNLPVTEPLLLTMRLGPEQQAVALQAEVISSTEETNHQGSKRFSARVKFKNIDKSVETLLEQHINHVLDQTYHHCREYQYKASA